MNTFIEESSKKIPVVADVDVVVVGGGTAGAVAGILSARNGAKTLIVEQQGVLGGSQTAALVTPMMHNHVNGQPLIGGIDLEILERSRKYDPQNFDGQTQMWFDPIMLGFLLDEMVEEADCDTLFHTSVLEPIMEGNTIKGVIVENRSGRGAIMAKIAIDCSGDAEVAYRAGVPCVSGRVEDGRNQAMSLRFILGGVNFPEVVRFFNSITVQNQKEPLFSWGFSESQESPMGDLVRGAITNGVLEEDDLGYFQFFTMIGRPGDLAFNCPRITGLKPTDAWDLSQAQIVGRKKILRVIQFLKQYIPGFKESHLVQVAPMVGIRESRRIVGEYVLTADDFVQARKFDDSIAKNCYPIDIHSPDGKGTELGYLPPGAYHEIPYRCLLPLKVENLLVAGRCISSTFEAQASIRIQSDCRAFGEAAGTAAALAIKTGSTPRNLDVSLLLKRLKEQGANL